MADSTSMADKYHQLPQRRAATAAARQRWESRYREGCTPWDTQTTPPEVVAFWQSGRLPRAGIALDLGCGPGTNVRYLARLGLTAVGVEIAGAPLQVARRRLAAQEPELADRAHFLCADVTTLPFHNLAAAYILDVGCFHSLPPDLRPWYVQNIIVNLAPGGYYQLYAFDSDPDPSQASSPVGFAPGEIAARFAPHLTLIEEVIAHPDRRPCRWYLLQRPPT